jgi:glycosyltransferase involved in cell wall biosynthesis
MTTPVAQMPQTADAGRLFNERIAAANAHPLALCHFTTAHTSLKSRSYHRQCLPLAAAGVHVSYVSPAKPEGRHNDIEFVRIADPKSLFGRALGQVKLLRTLLHQHADVYLFQDPQLVALALILKLAFRRHVIYDAYEDFPSMAAQKASIPRWLRPWASQSIAALESVAALCFDAILTADSLTLRRLARTGSSHKRVFYNFPNLDFFPRPARQIEKRFDLVYRGGISERAGTFLLLDALRLLTRESRRPSLLLIGYCDHAAAERKLRDRIASLGLSSQVTICGRIPHDDMAAALGQARVGICPLNDTPKFRLNIPVKIFEYWACGLPVVASDLRPSRPFVHASGAGLLFPAGDAVALARGITNLLDQPDHAEQMGARGRAIVEQRLNNSAEARKLLALCARLVPQSKFARTQGLQHA